jgi:hypothetical protein
MSDKIHDLRSGGDGDGVVLIVRRGNKYGPAHAGERVRVDASELRNRSTMEACMSEEDYAKFLAERAAKAKKAEPKKSQLASLVDDGLQRLMRAAQDKQREREALEAEAPPATPLPVPVDNTAAEGIALVESEAETEELGELPPTPPLPQPGGKARPPLSSQPKSKK